MNYRHALPQPPHIDTSFIKSSKEDDFFTYPNLYSAIVRNAVNRENYKFVEIGSWKGRSSAYMGAEIEFHSRYHGNKYKISFDTIDTFKGSPEHQSTMKTMKKSLYDICKEQIAPVSDYVNIIKGDSVEVSSRYEDESLDFVFIDGDHSYDGVTRDIKAYWPKVRIGGIISGHDYEGAWVECKKAVNDFFPTKKPLCGDLQWPIGEICWGVKKTSPTSYCSFISELSANYIKEAFKQSSFWLGFSGKSHGKLMDLYLLENF